MYDQSASFTYLYLWQNLRSGFLHLPLLCFQNIKDRLFWLQSHSNQMSNTNHEWISDCLKWFRQVEARQKQAFNLGGKQLPMCLKVFQIKTFQRALSLGLRHATGWPERIMYEDWCTLLTWRCAFSGRLLAAQGLHSWGGQWEIKPITNISRRVISTSAHSALSHHVQINTSISDRWPKHPCLLRSFLVQWSNRISESCVIRQSLENNLAIKGGSRVMLGVSTLLTA